MNQKIIKKLTDLKFTSKLVGLQNKEEAKKAFEDEGIRISDKQLSELGVEISEVVDKILALPSEKLEKSREEDWKIGCLAN